MDDRDAINEIRRKIADADAMGSRWLSRANDALEAGKFATAERLYAKGQYWLDRSNDLHEKLFVLSHASLQETKNG